MTFFSDGLCRRSLFGLIALIVAAALPSSASAQAPQSRFATVNGIRLHYLVAGKGTPITQAKLAASQVDGGVIKGSGHWLMEEAQEGDSETGEIPQPIVRSEWNQTFEQSYGCDAR